MEQFINLDSLDDILNNQQKYYSTYRIYKDKPDGTVKVRKITSPNMEYKELLKSINNYMISNDLFLIHSKSFAWANNLDRFDCVAPHVNQRYVVEADIKNYFDNVTEEHLIELFNRHNIAEIGGVPIESIIKLVTIPYRGKLQLPQGFPTSPYFANAVRYPMDCDIEAFAKANNYRFTSYGDNFFLSGYKINPGLKNSIKAIAEKYNFYIPNRKIKVMPYYKRQMILGIIINKKLSVPKEYVNETIGSVIKCIKNNEPISPSLRGKIAVLKQSTNQRNYNYINKLLENYNG